MARHLTAPFATEILFIDNVFRGPTPAAAISVCYLLRQVKSAVISHELCHYYGLKIL